MFLSKQLRLNRSGSSFEPQNLIVYCSEDTHRDHKRLEDVWGKVSDRAQRECLDGVKSAEPALVYGSLASCVSRIVSQRREAEQRFNARAEACEENRKGLRPCDR